MAPIELPWVAIIPSKHIYTAIYKFLMLDIYGCGFKVYQCLGMIWILGSLFCFVRLIYRYVNMYRKIFSLRSAQDDRMNELLAKVYSTEKGKSGLEVIKSSEVYSPFSVGVIKSKIIIPDMPFSDKELYYIIKHEYLHLKNHDFIVQLMVNILCAVYWWNPSAYLLRRNLQHDFEIRCDQMAVERMDKREVSDYLETLLKVFVLEKNSKSVSFNESGFLGNNIREDRGLIERFRIMEHNLTKKQNPHGMAVATLTTLIILVLSYSVVIQSSFSPIDEEFGGSNKGYEVSADNSYVLKKNDGTYWLIERSKKTQVSEETMIMMKDAGFKIIEESDYEDN